MIFPIPAYGNMRVYGKFPSTKEKSLYDMCMGHLQVWRKSHTFVLDIYNYFLQCRIIDIFSQNALRIVFSYISDREWYFLINYDQ